MKNVVNRAFVTKKNLIFKKFKWLLVPLVLLTLNVHNACGLNYAWNLATNSYSSASASTVTWSNSNCPMVLTRNGNGNTAVNNYLGGSGSYTQTRMYSGNKLTFTPASGIIVTRVEVTTATNYADEFAGATWTNASCTDASVTLAVLTPTNGANAFYGVFGAQQRITKVTVFYYEVDNDCDIFHETFDNMNSTGGNDGSWSGAIATGNIGTSPNYTDRSTWTITNGKAASTCIKLGTTSSTGSAVTPSISVTSGKSYLLTYKAGAWSGDNCTLTITATGANVIAGSSSGQLTKGAFDNCSATFTATSSSMTITITGQANRRFFLDEFCMTEVVASCSGNASASSASASTNSSFTLTSLTSAVAASTTGWSVGSGCAWTDYGFVWSDGANTTTPTLESNGTASSNCTKVQIGSSGTVTEWATSTSPKIISQTWVVGHTYYIRAYGKNGYASATYQYTDATSFTLRSVTFDSNGGSSVDTWYVKSGGSYSAPTAPTKTGYNFGGWYTDNGTFESAVSWPATISSNQTYYAKWTAKTSTVTLNRNGATTGSNQTVSATYGSAMPLTTTSSAAISAPTKTAATLLGYWDTDASTGGKQYYSYDGSSFSSAATWDKEGATVTLYARFEDKKDYYIDDMHGTTGYTGTGKVMSGAGYTVPGPLDDDASGNDCETAHYRFVGWVVTSGQNDDGTIKGTPTIYLPGDTKNAGGYTYYAVWAEE